MATLQFGALRPHIRNDQVRGSVGDYALHLQTPWRLVHAGEMVVASRDFYTPADPEQDDLDWDGEGLSLYDIQLAAWLERTSLEDRTVCASSVDELGGFQVEFRCGAQLTVYSVWTSTRRDAEEWRIFEPGSGAVHFVKLAGGRIQDDSEP